MSFSASQTNGGKPPQVTPSKEDQRFVGTKRLHNCQFPSYLGSSWTGYEFTTQQQPNANVKVSQIQFQTQKMDEIQSNSVVEVTQKQYYQSPSYGGTSSSAQVPTNHGPLDPRLGTSAKDGKCTTCAKPLIECVGHFGHIQLELPVYHIGFIREIGRVLQSICKRCSRVLLPSQEHYEFYSKQMKSVLRANATGKVDRRRAIRINDDILEVCKRTKVCPHCDYRNGQVKRITGLLKFVHDLRQKETKKDRERKLEEEEYRKLLVRERIQQQIRDNNILSMSDDLSPHSSSMSTAADVSSNMSSNPTHGLLNSRCSTWREELDRSLRDAKMINHELTQHIDKILFEISPLQVLRLFINVPNEDCYLLNLDPLLNRPESLVLTRLPVPPACIRPSVSMGTSGTNEDDLTIKIGEIAQSNAIIRAQLGKIGQPNQLMMYWDLLQGQVAQFINSDAPGLSKSIQPLKPIRALVQRLKGKQGRFRGNLSGKRVDFSGRTVISPDPNLAIDQVGVPMRVAKVLTFPERVTIFNVDRLRRCILNGPDNHPGANIVEFPQSNRKVNLRFAKRAQVAAQLIVGDIVERHLDDNDVVLFNRQPSLHRMSIMSHRAKIHEWRTLRFNPQVCTPYNADFDGDEMNIHLPQTYEARAEASELMNVLKNLVTPRHGEPLVCATQDFITGAFLITSKNRFLTRSQFLQYTTFMDDGGDMSNERLSIPPPAIVKPMQYWTGKQLFSFILSPTHAQSALLYIPYVPTQTELNTTHTQQPPAIKRPLYHPNYTLYRDVAFPSVTVELRASNCKQDHCMDPNDGFITIRNSELLSGNITKDALGGSKKGMYYQIIRAGSDGVLSAARFLSRLAKFAARFVQTQGFSIGIDDVTPSAELSASKQKLVDAGYAKSLEYIQQYKLGQLQLRPGCNELETLEASLLGELSAIRSDSGQQCFDQLNILYNTPLIMAVSGSKGSKINIAQMTACVGQQAINGSRIPEGFHLRTLPHFPKHSRDPNAKGFVQNSFYTGLTASEFFFHTCGGREGLVDTAVKTAETGYMQRRLLKALEDLAVQYDRSVRTSDGNICQFVYGDDGLDPLYMADAPLPVNFSLYWDQIRAIVQSWAKSYLLPNNRTIAISTLTTETDVPVKPIRGRKAVNASVPTAISALNCSHPSNAPKTAILDVFSSVPCHLASVLPKALLQSFTHIHVDRSDDTKQFVDWVTITLSNPYKHYISDQMISKEPALLPIRQLTNKYIPQPTQSHPNPLSNLLTSDRLQHLQHPHTYLYPIEIMITICGFALHPQTIALCSTRFILSMLTWAEMEYKSMMSLLTHPIEDSMNDTVEEPHNIPMLLQNKPVTTIHVNLWLNGSKFKYLGAIIESGTAVGAIAGQSIGEPGTQMTLKTFHFAGVASMSITQGVPRIKEIINASKKIATPIITAPLENSKDQRVARLIKGKIETTTLGQIAKRIESYFTSSSCGIEIELNNTIISNLQLNITIESVIQSLRTARKLKLKDHCSVRFDLHGNSIISITGLKIDTSTRSNNSYTCAASMLQLLHGLKHEVSKVVVQGIPSITRAVINDEGNDNYSLIVEGYDMLSVMGIPGIRGSEVRSNHVIEIAATLGIEAARSTIIAEIKSSMDNYGLTIDMRHMMLLADIMTYRGEVLGITRFGIAKMKESTLMLASFEKTSDHLFEAALRGTADDVCGVSESIILGKTIPIGTGLFRLQQIHKSTVLPSTLAFTHQNSKLMELPLKEASMKNDGKLSGFTFTPGVRRLVTPSSAHGYIPAADIYRSMKQLPSINHYIEKHARSYQFHQEAKGNLSKIRQERAQLANTVKRGEYWSSGTEADLTLTERQLTDEELSFVRSLEVPHQPHSHLAGRSTFTRCDPFAVRVPLISRFTSPMASVTATTL